MDQPQEFPTGIDNAITKTGHEVGCESKEKRDPELPFNIERYEIVECIGRGGFGKVFLAFDPLLKRHVAIKTPHSELVFDPRVWNQFIDEARAVASLQHDSIVTVFDVERGPSGVPYVIMEYVEGETLQDILRQPAALNVEMMVEILEHIGNALAYAHQKPLIHRDLKPANIIIDKSGKVILADFGLALHDLAPLQKVSDRREGTPVYMAPEQIRCENHRIDARTDLWGLGVTMYEMFTGQLPFLPGDGLSSRICNDDPIPIRSLNSKIPVELARICMKCLSKLMKDRYVSTGEMLDDLDAFRANCSLRQFDAKTNSHNNAGLIGANKQAREVGHHENFSEKQLRIVPKGLRSFEQVDADFFVDLLPGPRDRFGLPESLRFWLNRLSSSSESKVPVGLIYGASGCGKSSYVKAGLIPRLSLDVHTIYIESAGSTTEQQIVRQLAELAPFVVSEDDDVVSALNAIRIDSELRNCMVVIILDQFEQWLSENSGIRNQDLIRALRQCDGVHVSAVLLVPSDFWVATSEFLEQIEVSIQEGVNALHLPLFNRRHAKNVLRALGRSFGELPQSPEPLSKAQEEFLDSAITELEHDGKVIPVHLSLLAQMLEAESWNAEALKKVGGWAGVGFNFLEQQVGQPRLQNYQQTLQTILAMMLPKVDGDIKGAMVSMKELSIALDLPSDSRELTSVLDILDNELRIISLVAPQEPATSDSSETRCYQLTHDFLVGPIREWLTVRQHESWRGRAAFRLSNLAGNWIRTGEDPRFIPSFWEYLHILWGVPRRQRMQSEKQLMSSANRYYGLRMGLALVTAILCGVLIWNKHQQNEERHFNAQIERTLESPAEALSARFENLFENPSLTARLLNSVRIPQHHRAALNLLFTRIQFGQPAEINFQKLLERIEDCEAGDCQNYVSAAETIRLNNSDVDVVKLISQRFQKVNDSIAKIRLALLSLYMGDSTLVDELLELRDDPTNRTELIHGIANWHGSLDVIIELLDSQNASTQSGCMLALSLCDPERFSRKQADQISSQVVKMINDPEIDSAVMGASYCLATELNVAIDPVPTASENWLRFEAFGGVNLELIRIQTGSLSLEKTNMLSENLRKGDDGNYISELAIEEQVWVGQTEIPWDLFKQFSMEVPDDHPAKERDLAKFNKPGIPVTRISCDTACCFCDWLSLRNGLVPYYFDNWLEPQTYNNEREREFMYVCDSTANGFRLPSITEIEYACRCGTKTEFPFGKVNDHHKLQLYAVAASFDKIQEPRNRIPNDWGFFDLIGNSAEWTNFNRLEKFSDVYGGSFLDTFEEAWSGYYSSMSKGVCHMPIGFRICLPDAGARIISDNLKAKKHRLN